MAKYKYVCNSCGSDEIRWDAWAEYDTDKQEMVLSKHFDNAYCVACEGETSVDKVYFLPEDSFKELNSIGAKALGFEWGSEKQITTVNSFFELAEKFGYPVQGSEEKWLDYAEEEIIKEVLGNFCTE